MEADMNIKVCSTILGHASTQITTDIYTHVTPPQMAREMKKMNIHRLKENYAWDVYKRQNIKWEDIVLFENADIAPTVEQSTRNG